MELTTRCPECETVFPVSLEQLQLRKGYIRCIRCAHIFDGFEAAVPAEPSQAGAPRPVASPAAEPTVPPPPARPAEQNAGPAADPRPAPAGGFYIPPPDQARIPGPTPARPFSIGGGQGVGASGGSGEPSVSASPPFISDSIQAEPRMPSVLRQRGGVRGAQPVAGPSFTISEPRARTHGPRRSEPGMGAALPADEAPLDAPPESQPDDDGLFVEPHAGRRSDRHKPEFLSDRRRSRSWATPVWAILSLCGLVVLLLQGVYVYRAQLANNFPGLRPPLVAACERIGCEVPYERHIEAIAITGSALRSSGAPEGETSNLVLEVTLRNTHERPQEWPTLVLDLKDASGTVVVRRNLAPRIWVPASLLDGPFAAGSELAMQLPIAVRGLQANGYQLDKFFP